MDAISNADRFALLLRQKLEERAKKKGLSKNKIEEARRLSVSERHSIRSVTGAAARSGADDLERTLIEQLLVDQFGAALINDPKFQDIIGRVAKMMQDDKDLKQIMSTVIASL
jgi:hypothetical protein